MKFLTLLNLLGFIGKYWGEDNQSFTLKPNNEIVVDIDGCGFRGSYQLATDGEEFVLRTDNLRPIYGEQCSHVDWYYKLTGRIDGNCLMFNEIGFYCRDGE